MTLPLPIDTHVHAFFPELSYGWMSATRREQLVRELGGYDPARVAGAILVEGGVDGGSEFAEARAIRALAERRPWVRGFIAPLTAAGQEMRDELGELVLGFRLTVTAETASQLATGGDLPTDLPVDLLCGESGWSAALDLLAANQETVFVLDHCARPTDPTHHARWKEFLASAARHPRVVIKLSGGRGDADDRRVIDHSLAVFGADRALVGSDWPISSGATSPSIEAVIASLGSSGEERAAVLVGTAQRVYGSRHVG